MIRRPGAVLVAAGLGLLAAWSAQGQPARAFRVGVIHPGGPYEAVVEGLREGLKELGLEEPRQIVLEIRDIKGDPNAVEDAARSLERDKVRLIYSVPTSVTTVVKRATTDVPIVFCVGSDPVALGLVETFARPGGRLTGIHYLSTDLTAKRLEILKEIVPKLRRVVTFYNPENRAAQASAQSAREAARQLRVDLIERHAASVTELRAGLRALKAGEADAFFFVSDATVVSQAQLVIDTARAIRLPTMFHEQSIVAVGALASYGVNYREIGRQSARYVQRVLAGTRPGDLPIENVTRLVLVLNRRTAREIGLTIPPAMLARADQLIE